MSTLNAKIQVLSNTTTNLTTTNATYEAGRIVYETDTGKFKIGNGTANWTNLSYHPHDAAEITSGTVGTARLGSGTANSSTYLRGDQAWSALPAEDVVWNVYKPGRMTTNETLARVLITSVTACNLTTAATGTGANATTAANATTVVELRKNGSAVGNFTWSANATSANVTIPANFSLAANDIFDLTLAGSGDATLANVSFTIAGKQ